MLQFVRYARHGCCGTPIGTAGQALLQSDYVAEGPVEIALDLLKYLFVALLGFEILLMLRALVLLARDKSRDAAATAATSNKE